MLSHAKARLQHRRACCTILRMAQSAMVFECGGYDVIKWDPMQQKRKTLAAMLHSARQTQGPMAGTGGLRKMRFAPPSWHTGKSGAARVCYVVVDGAAVVYLLLIFPKNEKANLTAVERAYFRQRIADLRSKH